MILFFVYIINIVTFLTPNWSKKVKTKNRNCSECPLVNSDRNTNFLMATDKSNVSNPDIFVVTDLEKYGKEVVDFLKQKFSTHKYLVITNVMCLDNKQSDTVVYKNCFSNFTALSKTVNAKNCFVYKVNSYDNSFKTIKDLKQFEDVLNDIYNKKPICNYHTFKIPEKYYTNQYRLVDIQYISQEDRLMYIFRDKDNNDEIYEYPSSFNNFYWYEAVSSNRIVEKIDNLKLCYGKYKNRNKEKNGYGGDINICTQHCVDYYLNNKDEAPIIRHNIMFFDIETFQYNEGVFPDPDEAKYPIVAISFRTDRKDDYTHVYLVALDGYVDKKLYDVVKKYKHVTIFKDEITMLKAWFMKIREEKINILSGYNTMNFDYPFIINRVKKLGINERELYKYGFFYGNSDKGSVIPGLVLLDQFKLFKEFHHGQLPSYSLNNVSILTLGHGKVEHEDKSIDRMYCRDIDLYLKYSTTDTDLVYELEQALGHISLQCEIRRVATCSHQQANSSLGEANGLYATQMKKQGLIAKNYLNDVPKLEAFRGGYVFDPRPGIYQGLLCDFDFKSLYPSIICTWNIGPDTYIGKISEDDANLYVFNKEALKNKKIDLIVDPLYQNKRVKVTLKQLEAFMEKYHAQITIIGTIFCGHDVKESINCRTLNMLMDSRSLYKAKMLDAKESGNTQIAREYNDKQLAFKILANMLYGALGQEHFRFYNPVLGESITVTGQEMIKYSAVHTDYYMEGRFKDRFFIDPKFFDKVKYTKNVVYGDTDSIFVYLTDYLNKLHLPVKKCPEVLKVVSDVQVYINKTILPTLLLKHNVKLNKSQMYLKNEFLMDRYYALNAKKKYASHIISQEGKTIDEIDIKGLEIKRSEIPPRSQKMLTDILNVILDTSNTKMDIKRKVKQIQEETKKEIIELIKSGDLSVAKTVAYSKKSQEYKVLPQHLLGMYTWNCLVGQEEFKYGSKGKCFNVFELDLNKASKNIQDNYYNIYCKKFPNTPIEAIVIPEGIPKLPEYFIPNVEKTVKYACDDRVKTMMSGLYVENDSELLF